MKSGLIEALSGHMEPILPLEITYNNTGFPLTKVLLSNIIEIENSYNDLNETSPFISRGACPGPPTSKVDFSPEYYLGRGPTVPYH